MSSVEGDGGGAERGRATSVWTDLNGSEPCSRVATVGALGLKVVPRRGVIDLRARAAASTTGRVSVGRGDA